MLPPNSQQKKTDSNERFRHIAYMICISIVLIVNLYELTRSFSYFSKSDLYGIHLVKRITAFCFIISALALFQVNSDSVYFKLFQKVRIFGALFLGVIGITTLFSYGNEFCFDKPSLFPNGFHFPEDLFQSQRMSIFTAFNFVGIAAILLLLSKNKNKAGWAHIIILPLAAVSTFFILGSVFNIYVIADLQLVPFSPIVGTSFLLLCIAVLFALPKSWLMEVYTSHEIGGIIARRIILPALVVPVLIGWLQIRAERNNIIESEEGIIFVAISFMLASMFMIWLIAQFGNKMDSLRRISDNALIRSNQQLELLSDISGKLLATDNPQLIIEELCNKVMNHLNCQVFFNYLKDEAYQHIQLNACAGIPDSEKNKIKWLDLNSSVCGCVASNGQGIFKEYIQNNPETLTDLVRSYGIRAYACHPLLSGNHVIGTLSFGTSMKDTFDPDELSLMKTVADQVAIVMARIRHQNELQESENRFRTIARSLPVLVSITSKSDAVLVYTNEFYEHSFGYAQGQTIGIKAHDLYFNREERSHVIQMLEQNLSVDNYEVRVKRLDGSDFWVIASIRSIIFNGQPCYLSAMLDITERKKEQNDLLHLNRTLEAMRKSGKAMMHANHEMQYLNEVCKIIIESGHIMVWIGFAMNDEVKSVIPVAYSGFDKSYIEQMKISWDDNERGQGPTGTAIRTGQPYVCRDMMNDPQFIPWRDEAAKRGYASSVVLPLISEDKTFGSISIYSNLRDAFSPSEVDLLKDLSDDLAFGIMNIRRAEQERIAARMIQESEKKYRQLFESMVEGFLLGQILTDSRGTPENFKIVSVNPAFERQTGLRSSDILGHNIKDILPGIEPFWIEAFGKAALTCENQEVNGFSADLNRYFRGFAFCPEHGYFGIIFQDVTEQILAQQELHRTKNYLENLINYANAPIIVWNSQLEIQLFNRAFERLTGYSSSETEGRKLEMLFPEETRIESYEKIKAAYAANWETIEIPILTKNKEVRIVLWNSANIYDSDNNTLISTIAQGNDITERIRAEQAVKITMEKLDLALENSNIGIWEWEIETDRIRLDHKIIRMTGIQEDQEMNIDDFEKYIHEDDITLFKRSIRNAITKNAAIDTIFRVCQNSHNTYINAKARVQLNEKGAPVRIAGVFIDITEMQRHTDQTLFALNEDLLRSNKELEQFAYVASHDLQEPLRMVSSFTQLLARKYAKQLDEEAHDFINFAVDGAQRMQILINDLLEFSRIKTRGKDPVEVDMQEIIDQVKHNLSLRIQEKKAQVTFDPLPVIQADPGQIIQLLQNLIDNALKFSTDIPYIHISYYEEPFHYVFMVKDNGIGIDPQYYDRIFQIFQRLHLRNEYKGTGIGLAICKRIVERHGGKIWVEPNAESGTIFKFTIKK